MPQKLTATQVQNIAKLARLELGEKEIEKFFAQLSSILDYFDQLQEVETGLKPVSTENIETTAQIMGLKNMTRQDLVDQLEIQEELIKCAPERDGRFVKVKNVL